MIKIKRALISVSDKTGLVDFARQLAAKGVDIVSTGGTAQALKSAGIAVREVSDYTGFPEILDGRVKTLHPVIYGGLLAVRDNPQHLEQIKQHKIELIDMVVVNLYPFERVTKKKNVSLEEAIENIDIGGPTMLRAAAKNYKSVAVVCNPARYSEILQELDTNKGILSDSVLYNLALEAFAHTGRYDTIIHNYLSARLRSEAFSTFPADMTLRFTKVQDLRYGENPHQAAAFYKDAEAEHGLFKMKQLHGKELSFNNFLDLDAAIYFVKDFSEPAAVLIKHNNPTGVAVESTLVKAYRAAWKVDTLSAFGGIIGINRPVDAQTAQAIIKSGFMECVIAPGFDKKALSLLTAKKNLRLLEFDLSEFKSAGYDLKKVSGGVLLQDKDTKTVDVKDWKTVTKLKPSKLQLKAAEFGWRIMRHVRSNAVILVKGTKTVGIGCGQTSRVDSAITALRKAGKNAKGSILISEAFLPKPDTVVFAAKAGIKMIVQTGGSIEDANVTKAADKAKLVMVHTGMRHFKH